MHRVLTVEQSVLYTTWLGEAEAALQQLLVGKKAVTLSYNGENITYQQTDEAKLRRRIQELSVALGLAQCARRSGVRA